MYETRPLIEEGGIKHLVIGFLTNWMIPQIYITDLSGYCSEISQIEHLFILVKWEMIHTIIWTDLCMCFSIQPKINQHSWKPQF